MKNKITRRGFLQIGALSLTGLLSACSTNAETGTNNYAEMKKETKEMLVYIGTYTSPGKSEGIYVYRLNLSSGELTPYKIVKNVVDPSFLAIDKKRKYLFAVNETEEFAGEKSGAISAFAIEDDGDLKFLNKIPSLGGAPCHVTVSDNEKHVLLANYVGGNAVVFPVEKDGKLSAAVANVQHSGTGPNKKRQDAAHAHSINLDRKNRFAYVCDLGIDKVMIYEFDEKSGKLTPNSAQAFFQANPGAGPRHFTFHPNNKFAFLINELDSTVVSLSYESKDGTLKEIQTLSTLPANYKGTSYCADIHVSPNGKFLYGSNRGHDSIAVFKIDEKTGNLELAGHVSTGGKYPRNFGIEPSGKFLFAANQNSDSITAYRINQETGMPEPTGQKTNVPNPVCLKFIPVETD